MVNNSQQGQKRVIEGIFKDTHALRGTSKAFNRIYDIICKWKSQKRKIESESCIFFLSFLLLYTSPVPLGSQHNTTRCVLDGWMRIILMSQREMMGKRVETR